MFFLFSYFLPSLLPIFLQTDDLSGRKRVQLLLRITFIDCLPTFQTSFVHLKLVANFRSSFILISYPWQCFINLVHLNMTGRDLGVYWTLFRMRYSDKLISKPAIGMEILPVFDNCNSMTVLFSLNVSLKNLPKMMLSSNLFKMNQSYGLHLSISFNPYFFGLW